MKDSKTRGLQADTPICQGDKMITSTEKGQGYTQKVNNININKYKGGVLQTHAKQNAN